MGPNFMNEMTFRMYQNLVRDSHMVWVLLGSEQISQVKMTANLIISGWSSYKERKQNDRYVRHTLQ